MSTEQYEQVLAIARVLRDQRPHWLAFYRELLGIDGLVRKKFPDAAERTAFEMSAEGLELRAMIADLRDHPRRSEPIDAQRVITVRLPRSLHESLREEAHEHKTSMNRLCIAKLLQPLESLEAAIDKELNHEPTPV